MTAESTDAPRDDAVTGTPAVDWRRSARPAPGWGPEAVGWVLIGLAAGLIAVGVMPRDAPGWLSPLILWCALGIPVGVALVRARPAPLLRLRVVDVLAGVVLGGVLRVVDGWIAAIDGPDPFPAMPTIAGSLPDGWLFTDVVAPVLVGPFVEELAFRGLLLVAVCASLRALLGPRAAAWVAGGVSAIVFVGAHAVLSWPMSPTELVSLALLGGVCAALVLATGRVWGAVVVHIVFNGLYAALAIVGALAS